MSGRFVVGVGMFRIFQKISFRFSTNGSNMALGKGQNKKPVATCFILFSIIPNDKITRKVVSGGRFPTF